MFLQWICKLFPSPVPLFLVAHHKVPSFLTIMDLTGHKPEGQVQPSTDPNLGICGLKQSFFYRSQFFQAFGHSNGKATNMWTQAGFEKENLQHLTKTQGIHEKVGWRCNFESFIHPGSIHLQPLASTSSVLLHNKRNPERPRAVPLSVLRPGPMVLSMRCSDS